MHLAYAAMSGSMCNTAAMTDRLPDQFAAFLRKHLGMSVDLDRCSTEENANALHNGTCWRTHRYAPSDLRSNLRV